MVESTAVSCIQSSHPDKNNNSVDRIISKKRREKIQGENFNLLRVQWCFHKYYKNYSVSTRNPVIPCKRTILHTELILLQEFSKKYYKLQGSSVQAPSSNCSPCLQALHTAESSYKAPYSIPGPLQYKQASSNSRRQKQHSTRQPAPRSPYSSSRRIPARILPGEIGFFPKGLSIVYPIQY